MIECPPTAHLQNSSYYQGCIDASEPKASVKLETTSINRKEYETWRARVGSTDVTAHHPKAKLEMSMNLLDDAAVRTM